MSLIVWGLPVERHKCCIDQVGSALENQTNIARKCEFSMKLKERVGREGAGRSFFPPVHETH